MYRYPIRDVFIRQDLEVEVSASHDRNALQYHISSYTVEKEECLDYLEPVRQR